MYLCIYIYLHIHSRQIPCYFCVAFGAPTYQTILGILPYLTPHYWSFYTYTSLYSFPFNKETEIDDCLFLRKVAGIDLCFMLNMSTYVLQKSRWLGGCRSPRSYQRFPHSWQFTSSQSASHPMYGYAMDPSTFFGV